MTETLASAPKPPPAYVWSPILPHLRNPLPKALSKPSRSALRQDALCSASRVSKLFNEICQPILYHTVVTDNLSLLLSQTEILAVRSNFACTRHLFIEYSDKTFHIGYGDLVKHGRKQWEAIGLAPEAAQLQYVEAVKAEMESLGQCLVTVNKLWYQGAMRRIFPQLETVAVGAIFGASYDDIASRVDKALLPNPSKCVNQFDTFLNSGKLKHFCVRDSVGPLSPGVLSFASSYPEDFPQQPYTRTVHLTYIPKLIPIPGGQKARYVADSSPTLDYHPTIRALEEALRHISIYRKKRQGAVEGNGRDIVDIEIYSSADCFRGPPLHPTGATIHVGHPSYPLRALSSAEQTKMCGHLREIVKEQFRGDSGLKDVVTWRRADEMGICGACGSGPPV